jgi:hypothetical protein
LEPIPPESKEHRLMKAELPGMKKLRVGEGGDETRVRLLARANTSCVADREQELGWQAKRKGCGIGYALAANSCEGVNSVDACTVAAPRCDHRFCGSKPQLLLAG